jgi:hypothetical protein
LGFAGIDDGAVLLGVGGIEELAVLDWLVVGGDSLKLGGACLACGCIARKKFLDRLLYCVLGAPELILVALESR